MGTGAKSILTGVWLYLRPKETGSVDHHHFCIGDMTSGILQRILFFCSICLLGQQVQTRPSTLRLLSSTVKTSLTKKASTLLERSSIFFEHFSPIFNNREQCQSWLIGSFDNEQQALEGAAQGKVTASAGGHEYVCASITSHPFRPDLLIAQYYFDNDTSKTFRFRYYEFPTKESCPWWQRGKVKMRLHRPLLTTEIKLKAISYNITSYLPILESEFEYLQGCDVIWQKFPWQHSYQGKLENEVCTICSLRDPTIELFVKDDLKLWVNELWLNDRVYDKQGNQLIGNSEGIPYKMKKKYFLVDSHFTKLITSLLVAFARFRVYLYDKIQKMRV